MVAMSTGKRKITSGFTLTEALLASAILAMTVASVTMPFTAGARCEQEDARRAMSVSLANEMMEEIIAKSFGDDDGFDTETDRDDFDDVDDYNGYTEETISVSTDSDNSNDPAADGLSRHVTTSYVYVSGQDTAEDPTFIRVTVEVKYKGDPVVTLTRLIYDQDDDD